MSEGGSSTDTRSPVMASLDPYKGILRVTVHIKDDYERAVRVVVNPSTDSWKSFLKDVLTKLRLKTDDFSLIRSSTKAKINGFADLRQNDIITLDPAPVIVDNSPLTDSPLSVARTKHMKYESVGASNQLGPTFVVMCTKQGEPGPVDSLPCVG